MDTEFVKVESVTTEDIEETAHSDYFIELNEDALKQENSNEEEISGIDSTNIDNLDSSQTGSGKLIFSFIFPH